MKVPEQIIREHALARIAGVFRIPVEQVRPDAVFGEDLKVSFVSYFRDNELDELNYDIQDVSNRKIDKELEKGLLVLLTVRDYCDFMVRCYETNPKAVSGILKLPPSS